MKNEKYESAGTVLEYLSFLLCVEVWMWKRRRCWSILFTLKLNLLLFYFSSSYNIYPLGLQNMSLQSKKIWPQNPRHNPNWGKKVWVVDYMLANDVSLVNDVWWESNYVFLVKVDAIAISIFAFRTPLINDTQLRGSLDSKQQNGFPVDSNDLHTSGADSADGAIIARSWASW